jgi:hypothetical protein
MQVLTQLIHPVIMLALFGYFLYAGYLGWQARRTRNARGEEKKQLIGGRYASRHHNLGSIALAVMVIGSMFSAAIVLIAIVQASRCRTSA